MNSFIEKQLRYGGMGGVPPMVTSASNTQRKYSRGALVIYDESYSRPDKRILDYVNNINGQSESIFLTTNEDYYPRGNG